ncbi:MAG: oligosaccharide flippase family protein [Lachnospiraceae bacterium]|nr:oligosaccharide flippase family protein [Lachnospiraceae bacterium]
MDCKVTDKYTKLTKNIIIFTIGNLVFRIFQFLMLPYYTRVLSTSEYGTMDIIVTLTNLLIPVFSINVSEFTLRFMLDKDIKPKSIFRCGIVTIALSVMLTCITSFMLEFIPAFHTFGIYFFCYLISNAMFLFIASFAKGMEKNIEFAKSNIIVALLCTVISLLSLSYFRFGLRGYFIAYIISFSGGVSYLLWICRRQISFQFLNNYRQDIHLLKKMYFYAFPMIPNSISWWISNSSDKFILAYFCNNDIVGIYSAAYKIPSILSAICNNIISAWQLSSVDGFGTSDSKKFYVNTYKTFDSLVTVFSSFVIVFCIPISKIVFNDNFFYAWKFIPILMIGIALCNKAAFLGSVFTASKKTKYLFYSTIFGAVTNILLNVLLIPQWEAFGAAIATTFSYFIIWMYRVIVVMKEFDISFFTYTELICLIGMIIQALNVIFGNRVQVSFLLLFIILCITGKHLLKLCKRFNMNTNKK